MPVICDLKSLVESSPIYGRVTNKHGSVLSFYELTPTIGDCDFQHACDSNIGTSTPINKSKDDWWSFPISHCEEDNVNNVD